MPQEWEARYHFCFSFFHIPKTTYLSRSALEEESRDPGPELLLVYVASQCKLEGVPSGWQQPCGQMMPLLLGGCYSPPRVDSLAERESAVRILVTTCLLGLCTVQKMDMHVFLYLSWGSDAALP